MRRAIELRLRRLEQRLAPSGLEDRGERREMRLLVGICAMIRAEAAAAGIDPATIASLEIGDACAAELEGLGDTPELAASDAAAEAEDAEWAACGPDAPDPRGADAAELDRLARRYAKGGIPAADADLLEWFAWASVRQARRTAPAAGVSPVGGRDGRDPARCVL
jgi:hypothetical protein